MNSRILKRWKMGDFPIAMIGEGVELRYDYEHLGESADVLAELISGKNKFGSKLKRAKKPLIMIGQSALNREDGSAILSAVADLAKDVGAVTKDWNGVSILHHAASVVGGLDLGFVPQDGGKATGELMKDMEVLFLHSADELDMAAVDGFVVYMGTHGDAGAHRADVILPGSAYH